MSFDSNNRRTEVVALTGIRAFGAWWVVLYHTAYILPTAPTVLYRFARLGYLGVDLFFVLSGFIISYNYWQNFAVFSRRTYRGFLWTRLARLYPVHLFALIVSALLLIGVRATGRVSIKDFSTWTAGNFVANALLVHAWRFHYVESWNNASWSVSCEWFAYLVFPALVLLKLQKLPWPLAFTSAALFPAIAAAFIQARYLPPFILLIKVLCEFTAGCLIFHVYTRRNELAHSRRVLRCGVVAALGSVPILVWEVPHVAPDWLAMSFPLVILAVAESSGVFERVVGSRAAVYWGRVSYSLYMTHNVTLWLLKALLPVHQSDSRIPLFFVYMASVSAVAIATYHLVEEPCRKWMRGRIHGTAEQVAAIELTGDDAALSTVSIDHVVQ